MQDVLIGLLAIILGSVLPPVIYILWIRRGERYRQQSLRNVLKAFLVGSTLTVILGVMISAIIMVVLMLIYMVITGAVIDPLDMTASSSAMVIMTAVIAAPLAEEFSKAMGVRMFRNQFGDLENGLIFGAAVGLGFAATENILYGVQSFTDGLETALLVVAMRSVVSALGHGSFTAISGYGLARWHRSHHRASWIPFYLLAAALHGFFNLTASISEIMSVSEEVQIISLALLFAFSISLILILRHRVVQLNEANRLANAPPAIIN